ncbi:hypothetical protein ACWGI8_27915 [Streptomyces sp. NPDC054841]
MSDPAVRPQFEALWYVPDVDGPLTREDVLSWTACLFKDAPQTALSFVVRLVDAARRTGDTLLCRAALDEGWRLLVVMPSAASALLPRAGALLADPDDGVRYRAAHLLAALGARAAPYADELAALLGDLGEDEFLKGTVGDHARWALTRTGDRRALPELVERLYAPYRDQYGRGYCLGDPHLPEVEDVLAPLRAHAEVLLPAVRQLLREDGKGGALTCPLGGDRDAALRLIGGAVLAEEHASYAVHLPGDFGPAAAPYADRVRQLMEHGDAWLRPWAAVAFWPITGEPGPCVPVLEEYLLPVAEGGDTYGSLLYALRALARIVTVSLVARAALRTVRGFDQRLSTYRDYRAILQDETIRSAIDAVLALL